jgi:hypothetical protein
MSKITTYVGSKQDCERLSLGTDIYTKGWWHHATTRKVATGMIDGTHEIIGEFWMTTNPIGASPRGSRCVIRACVNLHRDKELHKSRGRYRTDDDNLDPGFKWICVDEGNIFIDKDYLDCEN